MIAFVYSCIICIYFGLEGDKKKASGCANKAQCVFDFVMGETSEVKRAKRVL